MTIKLALLKSGEDVISDVQEMVIDGRVVGYFFNKPCTVKLRKNTEGDTSSFEISLSSWIPLSSDTKVPVTLDWVITLVNPIKKLESLYINDILKKEDKNDNENNSSLYEATFDLEN